MRTKNKDKELNHRHFIGLRLTDVELDLLDQGAACLSVSRSEYLRKLLLEKQIHHQMTGRKMAGCVLGFAGVVVINLMGKSLDMGFTLTGEGFILISQVAYGISTILINIYSKKVSPVVLSGTQFTMGGVVLTLIGIGMGGHLGNITAVGVVIIFYLAMVSAVAYTLWSVLLAWNDVSKVAIFGFVNPLCSVILSALILDEVKQAFNTGSLVALLLVCTGIYIVNCKAKQKN